MSEGSNWPRLTSSSPGANVCFAIPSTKRIVANGWPFAFCAGVQRSVSEPSDSSTPRKSCGAGTSGSTLPNVPPVSPPPAGGGAGTPTMNVIENALELPAASRTVPASVCVPFASAPVLKVAVGPEIVGAAAAAPSSVHARQRRDVLARGDRDLARARDDRAVRRHRRDDDRDEVVDADPADEALARVSDRVGDDRAEVVEPVADGRRVEARAVRSGAVGADRRPGAQRPPGCARR